MDMNNESNLMAKDLNQQGIALGKTGKVEEALSKFNKAIELAPMMVDGYKNIGDINLQCGNYEEAKNYYRKALLIEKSGEIYFQYGNACFMNDEPHEGLDNYNLALTAGFDSDEMLFFMGMAYEHMNDDRMALRYIQKAINKNPSRPDYKVKKISVLLRMNMIEDAKTSVDELLMNDPELYDGYHMKTMILMEEKAYDDAVEFSKAASDRFPEDADLLYDYANATALSGKLDDALSILENAKKMKYFEDAKAKFILLEAEVNAEMGDAEKAISKCKECIALEEANDFFAEVRFMLINLFLLTQNYQDALEQAIAIIEHNEKDSYYFAALYFRPFCLKNQDKEEEASKYYKEAVSLYRLATLENPEAYDAYLYRIMCLKDIEKYEEALELLEFMENLSNEIAEIYTLRADIYKLTGKESLAKEELEKAFLLKPELKNLTSKDGE